MSKFFGVIACLAAMVVVILAVLKVVKSIKNRDAANNCDDGCDELLETEENEVASEAEGE